MEHVIAKNSADDIDYTIDWSDDLATGESITTSTWTADAGITLSDDTDTATTSTTFISGGTAGVKYKVNCVIVTDNNPTRTLKKTLIVPVKG